MNPLEKQKNTPESEEGFLTVPLQLSRTPTQTPPVTADQADESSAKEPFVEREKRPNILLWSLTLIISTMVFFLWMSGSFINCPEISVGQTNSCDNSRMAYGLGSLIVFPVLLASLILGYVLFLKGMARLLKYTKISPLATKLSVIALTILLIGELALAVFGVIDLMVHIAILLVVIGVLLFWRRAVN